MTALRKPKTPLGRLQRRLTRRFRHKRMQDFAEGFRLAAGTTVLDVGGTPLNWAYLEGALPRVVIANLWLPAWLDGPRDPRFRWVVADARRLPFRSGAFDVTFSNAVIEHVGRFDQQRRFAEECRRVGRRYFVETPNRKFFVEPHLMTPFVHWLPRSWMARALRRFTLWGILKRPTTEECERFMRDVWLMDSSQMRRVFPDGRISHERFLGMPKSIVATRTDNGSGAHQPDRAGQDERDGRRGAATGTHRGG